MNSLEPIHSLRVARGGCRCTTLLRNRPTPGPYSRPMPRALRKSCGGAQVFISEVPLWPTSSTGTPACWHTSRENPKHETPNTKPYTINLKPCILHPTPYTLHPTPYTLHSAPYTLHPTPYTLHPTPYTLHSKPKPSRPHRQRRQRV